MNTSTNKTTAFLGGAFADGLTLIRAALAPVIMFVIVKGGWPAIDMAVLASVLFIIAALTDILDDVFGGDETNTNRALGWFDDIADVLLITGTLAAMLWSLFSSGFLTWVFAVPASVIILRDILIGAMNGRQLRISGWPETKFGTVKTFTCLLAVSALVATPWLSVWIGNVQSSDSAEVISVGAPWVGQAALALLWLAALMSLYTGALLVLTKSKAANDA